MNGCMGTSDVKAIIEKVEQLLAEEELSDKIELAIQELLNVVEALSADKKSLVDEVERLRKQLEQKKKAKNTLHEQTLFSSCSVCLKSLPGKKTAILFFQRITRTHNVFNHQIFRPFTFSISSP